MNDYRNALLLALSMNQPGRLLKIFQSAEQMAQDAAAVESLTGSPAIDEVVRTLTREELLQLLAHIRNWNANAKTSPTAQRVLYAILRLRPYGDIALTNGVEPRSLMDKKDSPNLDELLSGLIPYTERHINRLDRLIHESYVIDLVIGEMDNGVVDEAMGVNVIDPIGIS